MRVENNSSPDSQGELLDLACQMYNLFFLSSVVCIRGEMFQFEQPPGHFRPPLLQL